MERLNLRTDKYNFFDISKRMKLGKIINNALPLSYGEILKPILNGYPLPKVFAQETINGELIIDSDILWVLYDALSNPENISKKDIAYIENLTIDFVIAKPSMKDSIDINTMNSLLKS